MSYTIGYLDNKAQFVAKDTARSKLDAHKKAKALSRKHPGKAVMVLNVRKKKR